MRAFVGSMLFHLAGTWSLPLVDRDEPRFAEASREMIQRSDYVVPYFNNHFRLDKPPLTYWAQVASYRLFGENDFAARFPSQSRLRLSPCRSLPGGRALAGTGSAGGPPSSLHFRCKHSSTGRPPSQICGSYCSSHSRIGPDTSYSVIGCHRQQIKRQTSNIKHLIGGGCSMSRLHSDFWPKDRSGGPRS